MPDFSRRSFAMEIMDNLTCSGEVVYQTLRELEFINRWLGGNRVTLGAVKNLLASCPPDKRGISIADLGCGGGDMLKLLAKWGRKNNVMLTLIGIDANPHIIDFARENCQHYREISFETSDIFSPDFQQNKYDIIAGTLFYHHFQDEALVKFFSQLKHQARIGFVINDIHRHWLAYYSIRLLTELFSKSDMVKFDAPLSVLRAFTGKELTDILLRAGIQQYQLNWKWAFRWQVIGLAQF